jgi:hypothetical protein
MQGKLALLCWGNFMFGIKRNNRNVTEPRTKNHLGGLGYTLLQAIGFFIVFVALLEGVARTSPISNLLPYESLGNWLYQFEIKWYRLDQYVAHNGGVDVIILGNSLVNTGFDPDVVVQTYYEKTGVRLRVFNFGVDGLTVAPNSINAKLLVEKYHPALLIFVTEMRDYDATNGLETQALFLSDPWLRYQMGNFDLKGWIIDHSLALQHYLPYRNWMRADFPSTFATYLQTYYATSLTGYEPDFGILREIVAPDPNKPADNPYFDSSQNYQIAPSRLERLQAILDLASNEETQIMVLEMPVHLGFYTYVGGATVHGAFQKTIAEVVQASGGIFLPASEDIKIPLQGRSNLLHLNWQGASILSAYLGEQLAALTNQQGMMFISKQNGDSHR